MCLVKNPTVDSEHSKMRLYGETAFTKWHQNTPRPLLSIIKRLQWLKRRTINVSLIFYFIKFCQRFQTYMARQSVGIQVSCCCQDKWVEAFRIRRKTCGKRNNLNNQQWCQNCSFSNNPSFRSPPTRSIFGIPSAGEGPTAPALPSRENFKRKWMVCINVLKRTRVLCALLG